MRGGEALHLEVELDPGGGLVLLGELVGGVPGAAGPRGLTSVPKSPVFIQASSYIQENRMYCAHIFVILPNFFV